MAVPPNVALAEFYIFAIIIFELWTFATILPYKDFSH